ncbi:(d)CMP kinase [uncultured Muriicola sp.]|uniref:(d)CMP kinase n=1 Tax=uncultured Muriicola sp. TaxID=1583102 RepID=UPI002622B926|nr:(d)CMP kinase [uncultured Muriicola sp.]
MKNITIAIDGHSSTGKSTMAKQLAKALGYIYVDTGAMYRAVTLFALQKGYIGPNVDKLDLLIPDLPLIHLEFRQNDALGYSEIFLNKVNVENKIRTLEVSRFVSQVSVIKEVRHKLVILQKEMGVKKGLVMDGRDIGTVVFPDAELKIFMTATPEIRATRRYKELLDRGADISFEEVLENVQQRDYLDSNREFSPLRKADDAVVLDNSTMSPEQQFQKAMSLAEDRINTP